MTYLFLFRCNILRICIFVKKFEGKKITFKAGLFSTDGMQTVTTEKSVNLDSIAELAKSTVDELLSRGGKAIMEEIKNNR